MDAVGPTPNRDALSFRWGRSRTMQVTNNLSLGRPARCFAASLLPPGSSSSEVRIWDKGGPTLLLRFPGGHCHTTLG